MKFEGRRRSKARLNLVPLINIIFLLLIFFMFAGSIEPPDPFVVELPSTTHAEPPEPLYETIILHIGADGQLALNGRPVTQEALSARLLTPDQPATPDQRNQDQRNQDQPTPDQPAPDQKEITARIDVDAQAPTGQLADIMRLLKRAGVKAVLLSTRAE